MSTTKNDRASRRHRGGKKTPAPEPAAAAPAAGERRPRRWLAWLLAPLFLVGGAILTCALIDNVLWPRIPDTLVGTWRAEAGPQKGVTLEFRRNGDFQARVEVGGKGAVVHARAETDSADPQKLRIVSTDPRSGKTTTNVHTIKSLTENELVLVDPVGTESRMVRVK